MVMKNKAADTSGINEQARRAADLGEKSFAWYTKEYQDTKVQRDAAEKRASYVSDAQLAGMNYAMEQAKDADGYNKGTFRPLEQRVVADAEGFDTQERRAEARMGATVDVSRQVAAQRLASQQMAAQAGVSPDSMKAEALREASDIEAAKASAGAAMSADRNIEQQGYARRMDAANMGRNLASQQATQQGIASNTGNSSVGNMQTALQARMSGAGLMGQGFSTALQGASAAGQMFGSAGQLDNQARGQNMALMGQMMGMSDKNIKKKTGKKLNENEAIEQVKAIKVHEGWQYDPAKGGPNDGGTPHDGPMAQDVQASMGDAVAPEGKQIDLISMNGKLMASVQALDKRLARIEKKNGA